MIRVYYKCQIITMTDNGFVHCLNDENNFHWQEQNQEKDSHTPSTSLAVKFIDNNVLVLGPSSGYLLQEQQACIGVKRKSSCFYNTAHEDAEAGSSSRLCYNHFDHHHHLLYFLNTCCLWQKCCHHHWREKQEFQIKSSGFWDHQGPRRLWTIQLDCPREEESQNKSHDSNPSWFKAAPG